jgi:hypothetical protein
VNQSEKIFQFIILYSRIASFIFAIVGMFWALTGTADPFGIYERLMALNYWGLESLPPDALISFQFLLVPLGATCAGYFLMLYFIATYAFPKKEKWSYFAVVVPFLVWFSTDTILCIIHGAFFNVYFANIPSLITMLPVIFSYKYFNNAEEE